MFFAEDPVALREIRLLPLAFYPVHYIAATNSVEIIDEAVISIRMIDQESPNQILSHGPFSPSYEMLYRAIAPNYDDSWNRDLERGEAEHYLLIIPDAFESRCQGFIAWKEQQGFRVDILRLSSLGSSPTAAQLKTALQNLYGSAAKPVYAIIMGNTNNFPVYTSYDSYHPGNFNDDLFYSQLEGGDYFADIFLSRLPATTVDELSTMLSKILFYEQRPQTQNLNAYHTALMACSGLYDSQQVTKEQTADRLTTNLGYTNIHTMYNWSSGSNSQIQNWVNTGISILNYRGEGWQSGWNPGHSTSFHYDEVYPLQNNTRMPVITSIGCGVAMFSGYQECFGHAWMALGSPGEMRGAVAFMGPTWNTRTTINNWIDRGIYRGFCYHDITRSSPAFDYGKIYAYNHFIGTPYMTNDIPTHMREYVLFGNPDLWWRTDVPRTAQIYHAWCPNSEGNGIVVVDSTGKKVANAQVCFLKNGEQRVYVTDSGGGCRIFMDDATTPTAYTLTGWNLLPCSGSFTLPETGDDGDIIITEVKPDIAVTGIDGDMVEIANLETLTAINLKGWTIGDLDGYDRPFVNQDAVLGPRKLAVIKFVGPTGLETVTTTSYGLSITSRANPSLSSEEDTVVVRNTEGRIRDGICYHNGTGIGSTNESEDLSKLTQPTTTLAMGFRGWWTGPDEATQAQYESYALNWSTYAGVGGVGSIQRIGIPGAGIYDSPSFFTVQSTTNFGTYTFPTEENSVVMN